MRAESPRPEGCQMCSNYEVQLQTVQRNEEELRNQLARSQEIMQNFKDELRKEQNSRSELEEKFREDSKAAEIQLHELLDSMENREHEMSQLRSTFNEYEGNISDKINQLVSNNDGLCKKLTTLLRENDSLLGRNIAKSVELDSEIINLPQDATELQFYLLKLQQELITTMVAKERNEETHRSEQLFLKDSYSGELQSKDILIEELTSESDNLKEELEQIKTLYATQTRKIEEQEGILDHCQQKIAIAIPESDRVTADLQCQINDLTKNKSKLENDVLTMRKKIQNLQIELDNSEAVQRDFVKLSQSLQIQLEKIRQADSEVRWQHEDDVIDCSNCRKKFHSRKEKSHCSHCGRIFCVECNSKIIYGGPNRRPFKVCCVCHTLLDHETAPYFSNQPPQSPN